MRNYLASLVLVLASGSGSFATIIEFDDSNNSGYAVSSTDLLEGLTPTFTGANGNQGQEGSSSSPLTLVDGVFGGLGATNAPGPDAYVIGNGTILDYTLTGSASGYELTNINTYTGWGDNGRMQQDYTVSYSTVAAPSVFLPITSVAYHPTGVQAAEVLLSDSTGTIASNVGIIRFSFPGVQNGYVGYHELDVLGTASPPTPEPSSCVLLGLGAIGLALVARRRRQA